VSILGAAILDVLVTAIVLISGAMSWVRGFAEELVTLVCWALSLWVAFQYAEPAAQFIPASWDTLTIGGRSYGLDGFHVLFAGFVLFLITFLLASQFHRLMTPLFKSDVLRRVNRTFGFLFGLLRGGVLVLVLTLILGTTAITQADFWGESVLLPYFVDAAQQVIALLPDKWQGYFHYPAPTTA